MDKKILDEEWNIQGFIGTPMILYYGSSCLYMKELGYTYTKVFYIFHDDYGDMYYNMNDLMHIYKEITERYKKDKDYYKKLRKTYKESFAKYSTFIESLKNLEGKDLFELHEKIFWMAVDSVKLAHMIEAFSLFSEKVLREKIVNTKHIETLTQPVTPSWTADAEKELFEISKLENKEEKLKNHAKKYFWIRNNYLSGSPLTIKDFKDELKEITDYKYVDYGKIKQKKN